MSNRRQLVRKAFIFQLKLGLDAIRDLLLSPVALIALVVDLISNNNISNGHFYRLMSWGRLSDGWIRLFELDSESSEDAPETQNVDSLIAQIESGIKQKTLTSTDKQKLQQYLDSVLKNKPSNDEQN